MIDKHIHWTEKQCPTNFSLTLRWLKAGSKTHPAHFLSSHLDMDRKIQGIEPTVLELQTCSAIAQAPLSTDWDRSE